METDKKYFDAACIFGAAAVAQLVIPWPLDSLLFPGALAYWWVQTNQRNVVVDYAFDKARPLVGNARSILATWTGAAKTINPPDQQ